MAPPKPIRVEGGIWDVVHEIRRRVALIKPAVRSKSYTVPYIERVPLHTSIMVNGMPAQLLMIPETPPNRGTGHCDTITRLLPVLPNLESARATEKIGGKDVIRFIAKAKETEARHLRALWFFGNASGARMFVNENQLIIIDTSGTYGIQDGKIVGGPYNGTPVEVNIAKELLDGGKDAITDPRLKYLWMKIRREEDEELINMFRVVYTRSLWDPRTLLLAFIDPPNERTRKKAQTLFKKVADEKLTAEEIAKAVHKLLVPAVISSSEYRVLVPSFYNHNHTDATVSRSLFVLQTFINSTY